MKLYTACLWCCCMITLKGAILLIYFKLHTLKLLLMALMQFAYIKICID